MSMGRFHSVAMSVAICISCMALAACGTPGKIAPDKATVEVEAKPVPVACDPDWQPSAPAPTRAELAQMSDADFVAALLGFYFDYAPVVTADEQMLANCKTAAAPK